MAIISSFSCLHFFESEIVTDPSKKICGATVFIGQELWKSVEAVRYQALLDRNCGKSVEAVRYQALSDRNCGKSVEAVRYPVLSDSNCGKSVEAVRYLNLLD